MIIGALDTQSVTFAGDGTLTINPTASFNNTGIGGLAAGDTIDFAGKTVTSAVISGSTLIVTESGGTTLSYNIAGTFAGDYFALTGDGHGGTDLVLSPASVSVAVSVVGGEAVQVGQTLFASATIAGDASDQTDAITYQWQISSDGGQHWNNVAATTTGQFNGIASSFLQLGQAEAGDLVRAEASFTGDTGQITTGASAQTVAVADITPTLSVPFSYAVDNFTVVDGGSTFDDNFSNGPPPIGGLLGAKTAAFGTIGSVWTETNGQAIMASGGADANGINNSVQAFLLTNADPEGTGPGESNSGLKENAAFTVSGTFALVTPAAGTGYGIELSNAQPGQQATEEIQLVVDSTGSGGVNVELFQSAPSTDTFTPIASASYSAQQLSGATTIVLTLAHNAANSSAVIGSFEIFDGGTQAFSDIFSTTGHAFNDQTFTRAALLDLLQ